MNLSSTQSVSTQAVSSPKSITDNCPQLWPLTCKLMALPASGAEFAALLEKIHAQVGDVAELADVFLAAQAQFHDKTAQLESFIVSFKPIYGKNELYRQSLLKFYQQNSKSHKIIEHLHSQKNLTCGEAAALIKASFELAQYESILEIYRQCLQQNISLGEDSIYIVGRSLQHLDRYEQAVIIFEGLQKKKNLTPLPNLEATLQKMFTDKKTQQDFFQSVEQKLSTSEGRKSVKLDECIDYSLCLINDNQFDKALQTLLTVKRERFV